MLNFDKENFAVPVEKFEKMLKPRFFWNPSLFEESSIFHGISPILWVKHVVNLLFTPFPVNIQILVYLNISCRMTDIE